MPTLRLAIGFLLVIAGLNLNLPLLAQSETTGGLSGQIVDQSGGAIAHATIAIVRVETSFRRTVQSDTDGRYSFPQVQPGLYRVEAKAPAFARVQQSVTVALGRTETVTLTLPIAGLMASVSVSAEPQVLNTRSEERRVGKE